jgi:hypothetical protein
VFESSQPITSGRENGADRCTQVSSVCQNQAAIAAADAKKAAAVGAIAQAALSGNNTNVTVVGNTDLKCGDGTVTGVASRGGNISCDDKLAGQRANQEAMAIALAVQEQVAGQGIHVQVVNASGKNLSGGASDCKPSAKVICIFATGDGSLSGRKQADVYLQTTPPPYVVQSCANTPALCPVITTSPPTTVPGTPPATTVPGTPPATTVPGTPPATTVPGTPPATTVPGTPTTQPPQPVRPS